MNRFKAGLRRGAIVASTMVLVVAGTGTRASAVPGGPTAVADSFSFVKAVAFDALANDTAFTGLPRVTATTAPTHGTASCGPLGGCLYTAEIGYTGADSFTYTITDDTTNVSTATVTLNVTSSPAGPLAALDDSLATKAGAASTVNVIANDLGGTGAKTVSSNTTPSHGAVACTPAGDCTYTPTAGFSGGDGFIYTLRDAAAATRTATVHVIVAPANASYALTVNGTGSPNGANWQVGAVPANVPQEAANAVGVPGLNATPEAPQSIVGSTVSSAPNWTGSGTASTISATATNRALVGDSLNALFPPPLPPISQGTGGDGHVPILVGSKVFGFFHHTYPTRITCIDRSTGTTCPGYSPARQLNVGGGDAPGPAVVVGSRFWTHVYSATSYAQTAGLALYCWDASTDSTCGMTIVDRAVTTSGQLPNASAPRLANDKMWFGGDTGRLYCVDPVNGAPCGSVSFNTGVNFSSGQWDSITHANRVFLSRESDGAIVCVDVVLGAECAGGWSAHPSFGSGNLVTRYDTSGAPNGVCAASGSTLVCSSDTDPSVGARETLTGWVSGDTHYSATSEAETGSRTVYGALGNPGLSCFDWITRAACTGGQYSGGVLTVDRNNVGLPSHTYGTAFDGACVVALGDPGQVFTADPVGSSPCSSLATGSAGQVIDLRAQRCDNTVGAARWGRLAIVDADLTAGTGDFTSLVVTVKNAATGAIVATREMAGTDGTIDLSGVDPLTHPSLSIGANATSRSGSQAWATGNWPRVSIAWQSDARAICFRTVAPPCPEIQQAAVLDSKFADGTVTKRTSVALPACSTTGSTVGTTPGSGPPKTNGYTVITADGNAFTFGLPFFGTRSVRAAALVGPLGGLLNAPVVGAAVTPTQNGYWMTAADGGVFSFGDAAFFGSMGGSPLNKPIVGMASNGAGGYWLVASDGGVFSFGKANFFGSMGGSPLNKPIVGMASTPTGAGYWLVASDGGVFSFGDAVFAGSTGGTVLNQPVVGMAASPNGGYWLVALDGGVFTFGPASFFGSTGDLKLAAPIAGIASTPSGSGYTMTSKDGGIFNFGDSPFIGTVSPLSVKSSVVAIISL